MIKELIKPLLNPFKYPWFLWCLLVINCLGSVYGYYWYRFQLAETPWYFIPFVPDSPLSSTLFSVALITIILRKRVNWLEFLAYLWVIKYGIWAVLINLDAGYRIGELTWENWLLSLSHMGMALEGLLFLRYIKVPRAYVVGIAVWLGINDYMDYVVGEHPYLFDPGQISLAKWLAIGLSVLLVILASYRSRTSSLVATRRGAK